MGFNVKKALKKVKKSVSKAATSVSKDLGVKKIADNASGTVVGKVVKTGISGASKFISGGTDIGEGFLSGNLSQIKDGATKQFEGYVDVLAANNSLTLGLMRDTANTIASNKDKAEEKAKKAQETADALYKKQQDLAAFQKDEAIRSQNEAAVSARRNMYRENLKQQASIKNVAGQSSFKSSAIAGTLSSLGTDYASGQASVSSQLANNLNNINTTYDLGGDISQLSYNLNIQQQNAAQAAAGTAGILSGVVGGASAGSAFGPWGAGIGAVVGGITGGYSSGAFDF